MTNPLKNYCCLDNYRIYGTKLINTSVLLVSFLSSFKILYYIFLRLLLTCLSLIFTLKAITCVAVFVLLVIITSLK